jgi:DNA helicase HerA-like ATPase
MIAKKGDLCGIGVFVSTQRLSKLMAEVSSQPAAVG